MKELLPTKKLSIEYGGIALSQITPAVLIHWTLMTLTIS